MIFSFFNFTFVSTYLGHSNVLFLQSHQGMLLTLVQTFQELDLFMKLCYVSVQFQISQSDFLYPLVPLNHLSGTLTILQCTQ